MNVSIDNGMVKDMYTYMDATHTDTGTYTHTHTPPRYNHHPCILKFPSTSNFLIYTCMTYNFIPYNGHRILMMNFLN